MNNAVSQDDPRFGAAPLIRFGTDVMSALGCQPLIAAEIAEHLVEADLCGVYSHGIFRLDWYAERAAAGRYKPSAVPQLVIAEGGGRHGRWRKRSGNAGVSHGHRPSAGPGE